MAKFYCQSGLFKTVIDAADYYEVSQKFVKRLLKSQVGHSLFFTINERGFGHDKDGVISLVPFLRDAGVILPPDHILVQSACESLRLTTMDYDQVNWLLNGIQHSEE